MTSYKEIVTKAVIGKLRKKTYANFNVECENKPDTVLGCWVINHTFNGHIENGKVIVNGSYDVNVWYSYDSDHKTAVTSRKFNYSDTLNVMLKHAKLDDKSEIILTSLKQPTVSNVDIKDGIVNVSVEKDMGVEIIGNTTVKIQVEDSYDDYEEIIDSKDEAELNINIDDLNDDFLIDEVNQI